MWLKVSKDTGINIDKCINLWESLKRSSRHYANVPKLPYKSGASTSQIPKPYREDWQFANLMSFYIPPSLKNNEPLVSISNANIGKETAISENNLSVDESTSDTGHTDITEVTDLNESVYVSFLCVLFQH